MDGRNYRNHIIIYKSDLLDLATEMKVIKRAKSTPELTVLQFEWAIRAIEKIIKGSDLVLPVLKQVEHETRAQVFKRRKKAKAKAKKI
jgi:hypothetical protein